MSFHGAVLVGGRSRRMAAAGSPMDKTLADLDGRPLARVAVDALSAAGADRVVAVGGGPDHEAALGVAVIDDPNRGAGPLAGIVAALRHFSHGLTVVVGGDLPGVTPATLTALVVAARAAGTGAMARAAGIPQPVLVCLPARAASELERALSVGASARRALAELGVVTVDVDATEAADVDTPADLARHRRRPRWLPEDPSGDFYGAARLSEEQ